MGITSSSVKIYKPGDDIDVYAYSSRYLAARYTTKHRLVLCRLTRLPAFLGLAQPSTSFSATPSPAPLAKRITYYATCQLNVAVLLAVCHTFVAARTHKHATRLLPDAYAFLPFARLPAPPTPIPASILPSPKNTATFARRQAGRQWIYLPDLPLCPPAVVGRL